MLIYFQNVTYHGRPLLWEFSQHTNSAKCTYQVVGNNVKIAPEVVNESLKNIKGIEISAGIADIVDFSVFEKQNTEHVPYVHVVDSKQLMRRESQKLFLSFFVPPSSTSSLNTMEKLFSFDKLLEGLQGSTLSYESLGGNNTASLEKLTALKIHSSFSTYLTIQAIKNIDYYHLRQIQIKLVRQLYAEVFVSSLSTFKPGEVPPPMSVEYFRQAITSVMENTKYNSHDTAFEKAYIEEKDPVPVEANYQVRAIYAKRMLAAFLFFIEDIAPPMKSNKEELRVWLIAFKAHIQMHKEKIAFILNDLEHLILCTGLMQHDYSQLTMDGLLHSEHLDFNSLRTMLKDLQMDMDHSTMAVAIKKLNPEHKIPDQSGSIPHEVYSLKSLVHEWFKKSLREKIQAEFTETEINTHVENIVGRLVTEMISCTTEGSHSEAAKKWISHTIKNNDSELYITRDWERLLESEFKKAKPELTITKKGKKHSSHLETGIVKLVTSFVHQHLEQLMHDNQTTNTPNITEMTL